METRERVKQFYEDSVVRSNCTVWIAVAHKPLSNADDQGVVVEYEDDFKIDPPPEEDS